MFNTEGLVVGIVARQLPTNVQMMTPRGPTYVGLTGRDYKKYFLPIDEFASTIASMPSPAAPKRRIWTGVVAYHAVNADDAKTYGLSAPAVMLGKVIPGTPAASAGLKERDLVIGLNGRALDKFPTPTLVGKHFLNQLQKIGSAGGKEVTLTVKRGAENISTKVGLIPVPKQNYEAQRYVSNELALMIREKVPPDAYADTSPTANVKGLIVMAAPPKGASGAAGVRRGDLLTQINGAPVSTVSAAKSIIEKTLKDSPGKTIVFIVQRGDKDYPISIVRPAK